MARSPVLSPVDYDAWYRGYMPPSEHVLIDALQFRGARVIMSSQATPNAWWLVAKGPFNRKHMLKVFELMAEMEDDPPRPEAPLTAEDWMRGP